MVVHGFHTEILQLQRKQEEVWTMHGARFKARIGGRQSEVSGKRLDHTGALDLKSQETRDSTSCPALWDSKQPASTQGRISVLGPISFELNSVAGAKVHSHLKL